MLGKLKTLAKNAIKLDQTKILVRVLRQNDIQEFIIDLNRIDQLLKEGVGSDDKVFGLYAFDQGTVSFKGVSKTKKRNEPISLLDKGPFFRSFDLKVKSNGDIKITADDRKGDKNLADVYGKEILGLSGESNQKLVQRLLPFIIAETKRSLQKGV